MSPVPPVRASVRVLFAIWDALMEMGDGVKVAGGRSENAGVCADSNSDIARRTSACDCAMRTSEIKSWMSCATSRASRRNSDAILENGGKMEDEKKMCSGHPKKGPKKRDFPVQKRLFSDFF